MDTDRAGKIAAWVFVGFTLAGCLVGWQGLLLIAITLLVVEYLY